MKSTLLTTHQKTMLEFASVVDGAYPKDPRFGTHFLATRTAKSLVKIGLISACKGKNHFKITPKGRIWSQRLGLMFLQN